MAASSAKDIILVRYKKGGKKFEVATFPGKVKQWRDGKVASLDDVVQQRAIYTNIGNGIQAGAAELSSAFPETTSAEAILIEILTKGEVQMTAAERKEQLEQKRKEIVNHLHKYFVNPKTGLPHPVVRIESALEELKVRIDPDMPANKQVAAIIKNLPSILPIKKQEMRGVLTIPHKHVGAAHGVVSSYVKIETEQWGDTGCHMTIVSNPGDWNSLITVLNDITKGDFNLDLENAAASTDEPDPQPIRGGKRGGRGRGAAASRRK